MGNSLTKFTYQRHYLIINHIGAIRAEHDDFTIRFASSMNQVLFSLIVFIYYAARVLPIQKDAVPLYSC